MWGEKKWEKQSSLNLYEIDKKLEKNWKFWKEKHEENE